MAKIEWGLTGKRLYETGVDRGVHYLQDDKGAYPKGVAWDGLVNITESPSGAEPSPFYADNTKYANLMSVEEFNASVEAYMYPDEFAECDGSAEIATGVRIGQQTRKAFGLSYRSLIGNDVKGTDYGYKLHLVYGALAAPSEKAHNTVNESPELGTMSWELSTTPVAVKGFKPTAHLEIDSTKVSADQMAALEKILYGDETTEARLPLPDEVVELFKSTPAAG